MQDDLDNIRMMMMEKITGTLDELEDKVLQALIRDNEDIARLWEELQARMTGPAAAAIIKDLPGRQDSVWAQVNERVQRSEPQTGQQPGSMQEPVSRPVFRGRLARGRFVWTAAVAACLILVAAGTFFYFRSAQKATVPAIATSTSNRAIQLQLAAGRLIDLSAGGDTVELQEAKLHTSHRTLSFQSMEGKGEGLNTLTVPVGMDYKIVLADGTEVWMNSATVLQFPFAFRGETREISLSGEAYLKVAGDATRPFIVHLPQATVQVLGTSFNVNTYDSGIVRVSLVSGAVKLKSDRQELQLRPGMEGVYSKNADLSFHSFDEKDVLGWMQGIHVFYNASIQEISRVLPRWYGIAVKLDNPRITSQRFSGFINRNKPIQDFLENLKSTHSADYYFMGDTLHLR